MLAAVSTAWAGVGDDLTSQYLQNADFSKGTAVTGRICTYDYDMKDTYTMYGQQPVEGWTAARPSDNTFVQDRTDGLNACASGLFGVGAYNGDEHAAELGGTFYAPDANSLGQEQTGQVLGMVAVWSTSVQYTQQVTLPAGCYTIQVAAYNGGGDGSVSANLCGFIADNGTQYVVNKTAWTYGEWALDEVSFILDETTTGVISVGYNAANAGSGAMPHLFLDYVKISEGDPALVLKAQVDALKEQLLPLLEAGDELGVDTHDAWLVYNNENATPEEVQAAIEQQKALNEAGVTDFTDFFISNAHFALGTPLDNGVCTYAKDMTTNGTTYSGMQPVQDWTPSDPGTDAKASGLFAVGGGETAWLGSKGQGYVAPETKANGATEGNVFGFVSCWGASASYTQQVTLPAGSYTITIPTYNSKGGTVAIRKNLCGFIAEDGTEHLATTTVFPVNEWSNETIKFRLDDETTGVISLGYEADNKSSGDMPHLFIDEFTLLYNGLTDFDPSLIALNGAIRSGENYASEDVPCEAALMTALNEAIEAGTALKDAGSNDAEANTAATAAINSAILAVKASRDAYAKFNEFLEGTLAETIAKYEEGDLSDFSSSLADERDNYTTAYEDGDYTTEQINEIVSGFAARVKTAVQEKLAEIAGDGQVHNLDISVIFDNLTFDNRNTAGWTAGQLTSGKFESQQNGVAEVWSGSAVDFTVSTTQAGLPAGAYTISAPAWYRKAGDAAAGYDLREDETAGKAYIFAGGNKTELISQYADQLLGAEEDDMHNAEVGGSYVANGQAQAQKVFYQSDIDVMNSVTTALAEEGELTFGFKGENLSSGTWTVWGGLSVVYKGADESLTLAALDEEIQSLVNEAVYLSENSLAINVAETNNALGEAASAGEAALEGDVEAKKDAITALKDAIALAKESESLINRLFEVHTMYANLQSMSEVESTDTEFDALIEESNPEEAEFENNAAIEAFMAALPTAWTKYVCAQEGMATATEAAPVDVTAAVINAGFEGALGDATGASYWDVTKDGGSEGYQAGIYEFYDNNSFQISKTIEGLTPGYYAVKVQAMYRSGNNVPNAEAMAADTLNYAQLFANGREVNLKNQLDLEDAPDYGYTAGAGVGEGGEAQVSYKDNEAFTVPNDRTALAAYFTMGLYENELQCLVAEDGVLTFGLKKAAHVVGDWCPFDNFRLLYLGTETPTAVECIKNVADDKSADIYDLQGRRIQRAAKGLYIKAGKVYIVK